MYLQMATLLFNLDYALKRYMEDNLARDGRRTDILDGKLSLHLVKNPGMAGGLMAAEPEKVRNLTTCLALAAATGYMGLLATKGRSVQKLGTGIFLAGSLGNVCDRWLNGEVTDYFSVNTGVLKKLDGMTFNLADVLIVVGTGMAAVAFAAEK